MQWDEHDIITPREVAGMLKLHEKTVRVMLASGKLPGVQLGKQWRCSKRALLELFAASATAAPPVPQDSPR